MAHSNTARAKTGHSARVSGGSHVRVKAAPTEHEAKSRLSKRKGLWSTLSSSQKSVALNVDVETSGKKR